MNCKIVTLCKQLHFLYGARKQSLWHLVGSIVGLLLLFRPPTMPSNKKLSDEHSDRILLPCFYVQENIASNITQWFHSLKSNAPCVNKCFIETSISFET